MSYPFFVDHGGHSLGFFVQRDHARTAQSQVVLQRQMRTFDLALIGCTAQLLDQLGALRQPSRAQGMAFAEQAPRRIGHHLTAIGVVAIVDERTGLTFGAQTQGFVGQQFVLRKAVVQFNDIDILRPNPC